MKRPFAVTGISALAFCVFLLKAGTRLFLPLFIFGVTVCVVLVKLGKRRASVYAFTLCVSLVLSAGAVFTVTECVYRPQKLLENSVCRVTGTADDFADAYTSDKISVILKNCRINGKKTGTDIEIFIPPDMSCEYGDSVTADLYIYKILPDSPADTNGNMTLLGTVRGECFVTKGEKRSFIYYAKLTRKRLAARIDTELPSEKASVVKALLLGDKSDLSEEFLAALRISGASHIFAVSGMHLTLWTGLLFFLFRRRGLYSLLPNAAAILFVLFYMALTGFSPSVRRAGIMLITVSAGCCFRRPAEPINSLGLAATVLLLKEPLLSVNVSFLLSFNATAALFMLYPYLEKRFLENRDRRKQPIRHSLLNVRNAFVLTLCVLFVTAPISGEYFGTVSLLSPLSALLLTGMAELLMVLSALALCFSALPLYLSGVLFGGSGLIADGITYVLTFLSRFTFAVCRVDTVLLFVWYALTAAASAAAYYIGGKNKTKTLTALLVCSSLLIPISLGQAAVRAHNTYMYLSPENASFGALLYTGDTSEAAVLFDHGTSGCAVSIQNHMERNVIPDIDIFVSPSGSEQYIRERFGELANDCRFAVPDTPASANRACSFSLKDGTAYQSGGGASGDCGIMYCRNTKTVFCFFAGTDFSKLPEEYQSGDVLVCRSKLPVSANAASFGKVIVLSGKSGERLKLPENAVSTADTGSITVIYHSGGIKYEYDR